MKKLALTISLVLLPSFGHSSENRSMTPDDLCRLETVGEITVSPDGAWVAYVLKRPRDTASRFGWINLEGNDRADVWLAQLNGGNRKNVTNGRKDGSGFWMPKWSPDGQ